ncbi:MAG: hypothetical protein U0Y82_09925 [Thermoleophilia bacterium]
MANGQTDPAATLRSNVISMGTDGTGEQDGPTIAAGVTALTGWRDSLYVGTGAGIVRTDLSGTTVESTLLCASPFSLAVDPRAPALYASCASIDSHHIPLYRFPLGADGSLGTGVQAATLANRGESMFTQGGNLYIAETYPDFIGVARMSLADPTRLDQPWFGGVNVRGVTASPSTLLYAPTGASTANAFATPFASPKWQTASSLPAVTTVPVIGMVLRGQTLFTTTGYQGVDTTSVNRQSIATLDTPTPVVSWPDAAHHRQPIPVGIYPGDQPQEWFTDATARPLAAGAFDAPIRPSSGLPATLTSTTPAVCTLSGATVTPVAAGTCTITGEQAGNAAYLAAPTGTVSVEITLPPSGGPAPGGSSKLAAGRARAAGNALVSSVAAPGAGTVTQTGTIAGRGHTAVRVCSATVAVTGAGSVTVRCRLNRAGRLHRRLGALTVTLTTVFTPSTGTAQTARQKVRLARSPRP